MKSANAKADDSDESQPTFDLAQINGSYTRFITVTIRGCNFERPTQRPCKMQWLFQKSECCSRTGRTTQGGEGTLCAVPAYTSLNLV